MRLNKIKLENIRSYTKSEIDFQDNSTLLAGDIGSGKSSILLAIDFALFGIRRGELSGNSLLRNGENKGSVELHFNVEDKEIIIKRTLKMENESVVQSSGHIVINNEKKEGTAVELKQAILDLLNYPKELLMKSKSLIYRYTVYTPQEEMKQILLGDKDYRLDTLRRVFGIDKYKRIKDNAGIYSSHLKGKRKELEGKISDLDDKKRLKEEKENEVKLKEENVSKLMPKIGEMSERLSEKKKELWNIEKEAKKFRNLEKEYENIKTSLKFKEENARKNEEELSLLNKDIERIRKGLIEEDYDKNKLEKLKREVKKIEEKIDELKKEINEAEGKKDNFKEIQDKISKLYKCPTCGQEVSEAYKIKIVGNLDREIHNLNMKIEEVTGLLNIENGKLNEFKKDFENLREKEARAEALKLKKHNLAEKESRGKRLSKESEKLKNEIEKLKLQENNVRNELQGFGSLDERNKRLKEEIDALNEEQKNLEIEKASAEREVRSIKKIISEIEKEIEEKMKIKKELEYLGKMQRWLDEYFVGLVSVIERKVMQRVHGEFNNLFRKWFDMLIENELMNVSLDEEFTPRIEQNGYDIDYLFLSGGEKTAAALAYRLALNQVINSLVSVIKTKDLLILDEPTDGFSYEQLERMEKVLHELNIKQILLVSHEDRIEGFVENVIKLKKEGHVTKIEE